MKIKISNLQDRSYNFDFEDDIEEIEVGEPYFGRFRTGVLLTKFRDQFILDVKTDIKAKFICDRCAVEFEKNINSSYKMVYMSDAGLSNSDSPDATYISPDSDKIEIAQDVRDYATLSIPMKQLCKDECKGLCYKCGKNLNEGECSCTVQEMDDRWKPLIDLKKKLS